jgi:hypothetical protein
VWRFSDLQDKRRPEPRCWISKARLPWLAVASALSGALRSLSQPPTWLVSQRRAALAQEASARQPHPAMLRGSNARLRLLFACLQEYNASHMHGAADGPPPAD